MPYQHLNGLVLASDEVSESIKHDVQNLSDAIQFEYISHGQYELNARLAIGPNYDIIIIEYTDNLLDSLESIVDQFRQKNNDTEIIILVTDPMSVISSNLKVFAYLFFAKESRGEILTWWLNRAVEVVRGRKIRAELSREISVLGMGSLSDIAEALFKKLHDWLHFDIASFMLLNDLVFAKSRTWSPDRDRAPRPEDLTRTRIKRNYLSSLGKDDKYDKQHFRPLRKDPLICFILNNSYSGTHIVIYPDFSKKEPEFWDKNLSPYTKSWIAMPLFYRSLPIGLVTLDGFQANQFNYTMGFALRQIADLVAIAVHNVQRQEMSRKHIEIFNPILFGRPANFIFDEIVKQAGVLTRAWYSYIALPGGSSDELVIKNHWNQSGTHYDEPPIIKLNQEKIGVVGLAYKTGEIQLLNDPDSDDDADTAIIKAYLPHFPEMRSDIALPIKVDNKTVGVLGVEHKDEYAFTEGHIETLKQMADYAALAIKMDTLRRQQSRSRSDCQAEYAKIFVAIPYGDRRFEFTFQAIKEAATDYHLDTQRAIDRSEGRPIEGKMLDMIYCSEYVIGDITGSNPNVFYELGYAYASKDSDKIILIARDEEDRKKLVENTPFDVAHIEIIFYLGDFDLRDKLKETFARRMRNPIAP